MIRWKCRTPRLNCYMPRGNATKWPSNNDGGYNETRLECVRSTVSIQIKMSLSISELLEKIRSDYATKKALDQNVADTSHLPMKGRWEVDGALRRERDTLRESHNDMLESNMEILKAYVQGRGKNWCNGNVCPFCDAKKVVGRTCRDSILSTDTINAQLFDATDHFMDHKPENRSQKIYRCKQNHTWHVHGMVSKECLLAFDGFADPDTCDLCKSWHVSELLQLHYEQYWLTWSPIRLA